jgi:hypothetical protein
MYPFALLNDPPRPAYPEYDAVEALAYRLGPQFVDPANLWPEREAVRRRGVDWCTAVLGRPYGLSVRVTVHEQYLLIAADQLDVDPPLPNWIVEARVEGARRQTEVDNARAAQTARDERAWAEVLAAGTVELVVHVGSRAHVRGGFSQHLCHAVPTVDVYSGVRKIRTHQAGRALCETETRGRQLALGGKSSGPATCKNCLSWTPKVRSTAERTK